jgi:hypothetical protein
MNSKSSIDSFFPEDTVSEELLKSVPKKVYFWIQGLVADVEEPGCYNKLSWHFVPDGTSTISYGEQDVDDDFCAIWWEGMPDNPKGLCGSDKRIQSIVSNMDFFTLFEENVFTTLETFEEEHDR